MKKIFIIFLMFLFVTPAFAEEETFYEKYPTFKEAINTKRIDYFEYNGTNYTFKKEVVYDILGRPIRIGTANISYLQDGKYNKVGLSKVKYNPDGTIKSMGPFGQVKYNKNNQIEKIGTRTFYYDDSGNIKSFRSLFDGYYVAHYAFINDSKTNVFYEKMLTDNFFNKYKNLKKFEHYEKFQDIVPSLKTNAQKDLANKYIENINKFNYLYNMYLQYLPANTDLEDKDGIWFTEQLKLVENWMKTHKISYKNPYEEKFKKADIYEDPQVIAERNKPENQIKLLKEEINQLTNRLQENERNNSAYIRTLEDEIKNLKQKQSEKIYSINGERVEYSGDKIHSIGGKPVQYW